MELTDSEKFIQTSEEQLESSGKQLRGQKEAMEVLKKELQELRQLDLFQDEIRLNLAKLEWLQVKEIDDSLQEISEESINCQTDFDEAQIQLTKAEAEVTEIGQMEEIQSSISLVQDELNVAVADVEDKKKKVVIKSKEINNVAMDVRQLVTNKAANTAQLANIRREVSSIHRTVYTV